MQIIKIEYKIEEYMDLLLEADSDKNVVMKYLKDGDMYILKDKENVLEEIVITKVDDNTCELKNIATAENARGKGYASRIIKYVFDMYRAKYKRRIVGTIENMISFYVLSGFTKYHHTVKNFLLTIMKKQYGMAICIA